MKSMLTEFMLDFGNVCLILPEVQPGLISKMFSEQKLI